MYGKMQESHWNHSFDKYLSSLGRVSCVFTSWVSSGSPWGVAAVWRLLDGRYSLFPSWVPSGLTSSPLEGCNCWWLWHPLFADMAGNVLFLISVSFPSITNGCSLDPLPWSCHPRLVSRREMVTKTSVTAVSSLDRALRGKFPAKAGGWCWTSDMGLGCHLVAKGHIANIPP